MLAIVAAKEMGAGRVIAVGAPENPRLARRRLSTSPASWPKIRIEEVRAIVGGFCADLVMDCSGDPSAGPGAPRCFKATTVPHCEPAD